MTQLKSIIGVDGGGTATKAFAIDSQGKLIGSGKSSPSNPNNSDYESAAEAIVAAIEDALGESQLPIESLCLGIAGVATEEQRAELSAAIYHLRPDFLEARLTLTHDLEIAHYNVFAGQPGALVIAGTGSACYARDANGEIFRVSGRDYRYEDPGSGYAIGKRSIDTGLVATQTSRITIAALARQTISLASKGDLKALNILRVESEHLVKLIKSLYRKAQATPALLPLAFSGSILESDTIYKDTLLFDLEHHFGIRTVRFPNSPPEIGALRMAWQQAGFSTPFPQLQFAPTRTIKA